MRAAREAVLLDTDLSKIIELDAAIATAERVCTIHQSRIAALNAEVRKERQAERQGLKERAIVALEPGLAAHIASAGKFEAALINFQACLEQYEQTAGGWGDPWRSDLFPPLTDISAHGDNVSASIGRQLGIPHGRSLKTGLSWAVGNIKGLAEHTAESAAKFLADLRAAPLPPEGDTDEEFAA
jgi:hypothetical protein